MIKKFWLYLPPSFIHALTPFLLKIYSRIAPVKNPHWSSFEWRGLYFRNPLGIAGGIDKNALNLKDWERLGCGFYEIGTVTPQPQTAHLAPHIDRHREQLSLWNHLGFPNPGLVKIKKRLSQLKNRPQPLFINLGKNRETPAEKATDDYLQGIKELHPFAEAFVINISSPNSPALRSFFEEGTLLSFLKTLKRASQQYSKPLLLKLHPDLEDTEFFRVIDESLEAEMDGWIFCNSTQSRRAFSPFPSHGGVSGKNLASLSLSGLKKLTSYLQDKKKGADRLVISVGGVLTAKEVMERLETGAHLVQVYSALVFEGPSFFKKVLKYKKN